MRSLFGAAESLTAGQLFVNYRVARVLELHHVPAASLTSEEKVKTETGLVIGQRAGEASVTLEEIATLVDDHVKMCRTCREW